ncbi:MAG TPA: hypothetical protein VEZ11_04580, partial [Thermoanaerobaculia bacterium]|nr:hypothetical protein [Thermoanaerobaculia bacterium]
GNSTVAKEAGLAALARQALSADARVAAPAIVSLRAKGQPAVDVMLDVYNSMEPKLDRAGRLQARAAVDRVCGQLDCVWSRLYWYTDLDAAKAEARRTGRPILSLRLLGNLDDELSCANSRFFRTILYPNRQVSTYLRQAFVLHWSSERPAPRVTIDYGDGRVLQRTITGNSIHYLLAEDGTPLDALPGLYAPNAFLSELQEMSRLAMGYRLWPEKTRAAQLAAYLRNQVANAEAAVRADGDRGTAARQGQVLASYSAWQAAPLALSKMAVERPMLDKVSFGAKQGINAAPGVTPTTTIKVDLGGFDGNTIRLIREKHFGNAPGSDRELEPLLARLKKSVAEDTLHNEFDLRVQIHRWLAATPSASFEELNRHVYSAIFLTPATDPWLGLVQNDTFTGIANEGRRTTKAGR